MLSEFVDHIASHTGMNTKEAKAALGIVLNGSERQGSEFAREIYERMPGARTLAAQMGSEIGAATGVIARLIEQTPGGRENVVEQVTTALVAQGLGPRQIGALFPAIQSFADSEFGIRGFGHLGDMLGQVRSADAPVSDQGFRSAL